MWPDYDLDNPGSWTVLEAPTVDSSWEAALTKIGGLNPFGKPMLVWRWGATYRDPMSLDNGLKYWLCNKDAELSHFEFKCPVTGLDMKVKHLNEVPAAVLIPVAKYNQVQLGERRIIIEQWRSQRFLARSARYQSHSTTDQDRVQEFWFCRVCDTQLNSEARVLNALGDVPACPECGSSRHYLRTIREEGDGKLLRTNPEEGAYDFFLRLENDEGEPMEADGNALAQIEKFWHEQQTKSSKEKIRDMLAETESQEVLNREATSPTNPFVAPTVPGW